MSKNIGTQNENVQVKENIEENIGTQNENVQVKENIEENNGTQNENVQVKENVEKKEDAEKKEPKSYGEMITLGALDPSQYKVSQQSKWTPEKIREKLEGYHTISFQELVDNQQKYIGTIVRYFRNRLFRSGGILSKVEITDASTDPPTGYAGFFSIMPKARWTAQSKTSEFWVQDEPRATRKDSSQASKKQEVQLSEEEQKKKTMIEELRTRWFTTPASLAGKTSEEKRIYVAIDLDTWDIITAPRAGGITFPESGAVPARVVYSRVQDGNRRPYRKKYFISRLNHITLKELQQFVAPTEES